jgi:hypothetical protein
VPSPPLLSPSPSTFGFVSTSMALGSSPAALAARSRVQRHEVHRRRRSRHRSGRRVALSPPRQTEPQRPEPWTSTFGFVSTSMALGSSPAALAARSRARLLCRVMKFTAVGDRVIDPADESLFLRPVKLNRKDPRTGELHDVVLPAAAAAVRVGRRRLGCGRAEEEIVVVSSSARPHPNRRRPTRTAAAAAGSTTS